ncbi:hypothetical protein Awo_c04580 [Acetobacterium woodii DSM 1030]|uniref:Uncharacterized protein n=1 Tax=Acetobacterium woodii (strain ATCC 29683 / DSM 1030 / JCM 2381 / KCTC 1655 / WB1) TaxID=931626 RepID=H6LHS8_ACEWD|nr:hypothetical protein Awo_c04580 [Acetobacterium woodii DSM 1030]
MIGANGNRVGYGSRIQGKRVGMILKCLRVGYFTGEATSKFRGCFFGIYIFGNDKIEFYK